MRAKEKIMDDGGYDTNKNSRSEHWLALLTLEVLCDIRDQLAEVAKLRYMKVGNSELVYSRDEMGGQQDGV